MLTAVLIVAVLALLVRVSVVKEQRDSERGDRLRAEADRDYHRRLVDHQKRLEGLRSQALAEMARQAGQTQPSAPRPMLGPGRWPL
jgi:type II secretory pathway component PulL